MPKIDRDIKQISLLATVPAIMLAAPAVGFFIGKWADGKWETEPTLQIIGAMLGFGAAGIETYSLIKKASALEKKSSIDDEP